MGVEQMLPPGFDERIAYITCACGQRFQVVEEQEGVFGWDEAETAQYYKNHQKGCRG